MTSRWIIILTVVLLTIKGIALETVRHNEIPSTPEEDEEDGITITNVDDSSDSILSSVVSDVNQTLINLYNQVTSNNVTAENTTKANNETKRHCKCKETISEHDYNVEPAVEVINASTLLKVLTVDPAITSREMEAPCVLVLFYARACPFSAHAAPYFNALARSYPNVKMVAIDALKYHGINAQYSIIGVPTLKMFHNGKPVGRFNGTEYNIQSFSRFVNAITGLNPQGLLVTSKDFQGPVSSVVEKELDYFLVLSWVFIAICAVYYFMESSWYTMIVEMVKNNWRESEAQHEHND